MKPGLLVAALIACTAAPCSAQSTTALGTPAPSAAAPSAAGFDPAKLDPAVRLALSGGRWQSGVQRGTFRLLLLRDGWDQVRNRLVIQWLEEQPAAKRVVVHSSRDVEAVADGAWAIGVPRLELRSGQWYAVVTGTTDAGRIRRTWRFDLAVPGKLREVQLR
ncbi:MAG: hypothetical protein ABR499_22040 [Gemmatimonadaceae bacterium]